MIEYEIQTDDLHRRVWVHASDGSTVARFDTRFGMDIHTTVSEQMAGASQCLHCTHSRPTQKDWKVFREKIHHHFGVLIPEDAVTL